MQSFFFLQCAAGLILAAADGNVRIAPTLPPNAGTWVAGPSVGTVDPSIPTVVPGDTLPTQAELDEPLATQKLDYGPTVTPMQNREGESEDGGWFATLYQKLISRFDNSVESFAEKEVGSEWFLLKDGMSDANGKVISLFSDPPAVVEVNLLLSGGPDSSHINGTIKVENELKFTMAALNETSASVSSVEVSAGMPSVGAMPIEYTLSKIVGNSVAIVEGANLKFHSDAGEATFVAANAMVYTVERVRDLTSNIEQAFEDEFLPMLLLDKTNQTAISKEYFVKLSGMRKSYTFSGRVHINNKFNVAEDVTTADVDDAEITEVVRSIIGTADVLSFAGHGFEEELVISSSALQKEVLLRSVVAKKFDTRYIADKSTYSVGGADSNVLESSSSDILLTISERDDGKSLNLAARVVNTYIVDVQLEASGQVEQKGQIVSTEMSIATEQSEVEAAVQQILIDLNGVHLGDSTVQLRSNSASLMFNRSYDVYLRADADDSVTPEEVRRRLQQQEDNTSAPAETSTTSTTAAPTTTTSASTVSTIPDNGRPFKGLSARCSNSSVPRMYQIVPSSLQAQDGSMLYDGITAPVSLEVLYNDSIQAYELGLYAANYTTFALSEDRRTLSSITVQNNIYNMSSINSLEDAIWKIFTNLDNFDVNDEFISLRSSQGEKALFDVFSVYHVNVTSYYDNNGTNEGLGSMTIPIVLSRNTTDGNSPIDYNFFMYVVELHKGVIRVNEDGSASMNGNISSTNLARWSPMGRINAANRLISLLNNVTELVVEEDGCAMTFIAENTGNVTMKHAENMYSAFYSLPLLRPAVPYISLQPVQIDSNRLDLAGKLHFHNDYDFYMQSNNTLYPTAYVKRTSNNRVTIAQFLSEVELTNRFRASFNLENHYYYGSFLAPLSFTGLAMRGYNGSDNSLAAQLFEGMSDQMNVTVIGMTVDGQIENAPEVLTGDSVFGGALSINGESSVVLNVGGSSVNVSISGSGDESNTIAVESGLSGASASTDYGRRVENALLNATVLKRQEDGSYSFCDASESSCVVMKVDVPF